MPRGWLIVVAVALIGIGAAVDALWPRGPAPPAAVGPATVERLAGPDVPARDALRGTLIFTTVDGCRVRTLDLATLSLGHPGLATSCAFWVSPSGKRAVMSRPPLSSLWLAQLGGRQELVRELGLARGEAAWALDGSRVAWCGETGTTTVLSLADGTRRELPGCAPRFTPSGAVLTIEDDPGARVLFRDGRALLREADWARGFSPVPSGPIHPLGADERADGLLAVVVSASPLDAAQPVETEEHGVTVRPGDGIDSAGPFTAIPTEGGNLPEIVVELWRGAQLEAAVQLPAVSYPDAVRRFGEVVRFSPDGDELAVGYPGPGVVVLLLDVRSRRIVLSPTIQNGFSWSPDGAWFALARGRAILVSGAVRSEPAYELPLAAVTLAWR